jgi:hypothetical protein
MQNQKTLTITAILSAAILIVGIVAVTTTPMTAYADKDHKKDKKDKGDISKTITKQKLKQKNVGSRDSDNTNCGQNTINRNTCIYH